MSTRTAKPATVAELLENAVTVRAVGVCGHSHDSRYGGIPCRLDGCGSPHVAEIDIAPRVGKDRLEPWLLCDTHWDEAVNALRAERPDREQAA